jgi:hypothetical protein
VDPVLTRPDNLSSGSDHTQLADVDLDDGTLGHHSQLRVKGRLRVLLYSDDGELEGGFQVGCIRREETIRMRRGGECKRDSLFVMKIE